MGSNSYYTSNMKRGCPFLNLDFYCPNCGEVHDISLSSWEDRIGTIPAWMINEMIKGCIIIMKGRKNDGRVKRT